MDLELAEPKSPDIPSPEIVFYELQSSNGNVPNLIPQPLEDLPQLRNSNPGVITLILAEYRGSSTERLLREYGVGVPPVLFRYHRQESLSLQQKWLSNDSLFFIQWLLFANQSGAARVIEQKIKSGRPYDVSETEDPAITGVDHTRYAREAPLYRGYSPLDISEPGGGAWRCAALEGASLWFDQNKDGQATGTSPLIRIQKQDELLRLDLS